MIHVRTFAEADWPAVWRIVHDVVVEQETFPYDREMTESEARAMWVIPPAGRTTVTESGGVILGTANMYANRPGPGRHIASGSFMVSREARRRGVGKALLGDSLAWATARGFAGVQFNAVVEGNIAAETLYARHGFVTIGTVPGAFESPTRGRVGLRVLFRSLPSPAKRSAEGV